MSPDYIIEAIRIRFLIVKAGRMATKTAVEDVLMIRHPELDRAAAHDVMNTIEYTQAERPYFRFRDRGICWIADTPEPQPGDYPEISA